MLIINQDKTQQLGCCGYGFIFEKMIMDKMKSSKDSKKKSSKDKDKSKKDKDKDKAKEESIHPVTMPFKKDEGMSITNILLITGGIIVALGVTGFIIYKMKKKA